MLQKMTFDRGLDLLFVSAHFSGSLLSAWPGFSVGKPGFLFSHRLYQRFGKPKDLNIRLS